jgi:L-lactate dehydrogenase complex protein LldG
VNARDEILERIRHSGSQDAVGAIPRRYLGKSGLGNCDLFIDRLQDYRAIAHRISAGEVGPRIALSLERRGARRVVIPEGFPTEWQREIKGVIRDNPPLTNARLGEMDGVVTTCAVAIAETGTIVLDHSEGQGRRALTLLPDFHIIVVEECQVFNGVPDAIAGLDPSSSLTWISGPSATSDIELERVEGVHGPRTLEVLVVSSAQNC